MAKREEKMQSMWAMRSIGAFKLLTASILLGLALGMRTLLNPAERDALHAAMLASRLDADSSIFHEFVQHVFSISPETLKNLRVGLFFYAGLHGLEGFGLIFGQTWAEWLVVLNTGVFVPWEVYEIATGASPLRISALVLNLAIMAYFIVRLVKQHKLRHAEKMAGRGPVPTAA